MQYNHSSQHSRQVLASRLTNRLTQMGFRPFYDKRAKEIIFAHPVHESPGVSVLVYTSCAPPPREVWKPGGVGRTPSASVPSTRTEDWYAKSGSIGWVRSRTS